MTRGAAASTAGEGPTRAAMDVLESGGSASDAVTAAFLADAGGDAEVLLAPVVVLVAGLGVGARAFDGRAVQPGKGAPRPRGYLDEATAPPAARAAVPRSLAALSLLHGYRGRTTLRSIAAAGVQAAKKAGATAREQLIRRFGEAGVLALKRPEALHGVVDAGGAVLGGIVTEEDVVSAMPAEAAAATRTRGASTIVTPPWPTGSGSARVAVAADAWGLVAALAYGPCEGGVPVPALEVSLPAVARPVLRGVTRVAPGTPIAAPAPIAVLALDPRTLVAAGVASATEIVGEALDGAVDALGVETIVRRLGTGAVGAAWDGARAVAIA